jgi:hypothetical protein
MDGKQPNADALSTTLKKQGLMCANSGGNASSEEGTVKEGNMREMTRGEKHQAHLSKLHKTVAKIIQKDYQVPIEKANKTAGAILLMLSLEGLRVIRRT